MALTIGDLLTEARALLSDVVATDGANRYSDADLMAAFNDAMMQARMKRPDVFLDIGMRVPTPRFSMPDDAATGFPLAEGYYPAFLYYVVGRSELREDTFTDDQRAVTLLNKFVSQLLQVAS